MNQWHHKTPLHPSEDHLYSFYVTICHLDMEKLIIEGGDEVPLELKLLSLRTVSESKREGDKEMPETREVSARSPKLDRETAVVVNFGKTAEESIALFGPDAVNSNAFANWRVTVQAGIRKGHETGKSDEEIINKFADAKMGVAVGGGRVDPIQASLAKFKTMNPKEQQEYLEKLRAAASE